MIKVTKTKNEIQGGCPHRILTLDIDLEDIKTVSQNMSFDDFYKHIGEVLCKNFSNVVGCRK